MPPTIVNRRSSSVAFYVLIVAVAAVAGYASTRGVSFALPTSDTPTTWQQMGVQVASEATRLLITLASALLGALGLLLGDRFAGGGTPRHLWSAFACALSAGVSLYYGYVVHMHLLGMIGLHAFEPTSEIFLNPSHKQFYALLAAAAFLADFAFHNFGRGEVK
jgi:hypothetical protein